MTSRTLPRIPRRIGLLAFLGVALIALTGAVILFGPSDRPPEPSAEFLEFYEYGLGHSRAGLWGEAVGPLKWATKIDPSQTMAHYHLCQAYFNSGDPEGALAAINVLLQDPEHRKRAERSDEFHMLYATRGHCLSASGDYEASEADFKKALELDSGNGEYYYYLCWTQFELARFEDALASGLKALELGHRGHEAFWKVGMVHKKLGDHESAVEFFREALRYHPGYTAAYKSLAESQIKLGEREEGKKNHEIARLLAEVDDEHRKFQQRMSMDDILTDEEFFAQSEELVRFCFDYWKYPELEEWMDQLLARDAQNPKSQFRMGFARMQLKKDRQAEEHFLHAWAILEAKEAHLLMMGQVLSEHDRVLKRDTANAIGMLLATAIDPLVRRPTEALLWARRGRALGWPTKEVEAAAREAMGDTEEALRMVDEELEKKGGNRALFEAQREEFLKRLRRKNLDKPKPPESP